MAGNPLARPRGRRPGAPRRGFGVFCASLVLLIGVLILVSPPRADRATADKPEPTQTHGHHGGRNASRSPSSATPRPTPGASATPGATPTPIGGPGASTLAALQPLIEAGEPIYCGAGTQPLVALTFDDGPGVLTRQAIDLLRQNDMTATFFTVGKLYSEPRFQGLLKEEASLGAVGDHTWDHVPVEGMSTTQLAAQIERTRSAAEADSGSPVFLFRPPLGRHDGVVDAYVRSLGMLEVLWSLDSQDSQGATADEIYRNVRDHLSPGDIVLLHDNRGTTEAALPLIIDLIKQLGYRTVTVPQLLALDPPTPQQLSQHTCPA
jgi:peptidoglycan/xylan/chitin deacetylase (PgdA/CDA1 family)